MLAMPSANMRPNNKNNSNADMDAAEKDRQADIEIAISNSEIEKLMFSLKANLRLGAKLKCMPCGHLSKKSSRASPYRVPGKVCTCENPGCAGKSRRKPAQNMSEDTYEILQRLIREGNLVNEAVRRLNLDPKRVKEPRYFYESDEESTSSPEQGADGPDPERN